MTWAVATTPAVTAYGDAFLPKASNANFWPFLIPSPIRGSVAISGDFAKTDKISYS
jgi:hypothetical protein